jgi:hypothetical protein
MSLIAGLLSRFLRGIGGIQAFLIRYIFRAKVSYYLEYGICVIIWQALANRKLYAKY